MKELTGFAVALLIGLGTSPTTDEVPTFHGVKLGVSLDSQLQKCPWNPPKEGDIPEVLYSPYKDENGDTLPCYVPNPVLFRVDSYVGTKNVELIERPTVTKDEKGEVLSRQPLPGYPVVYVEVLVPARTEVAKGTVEEVTLTYLPLESDRVRDALTKKFGASHSPDTQMTPEEEKLAREIMEAEIVSREFWATTWGQVFLGVTAKEVVVIAETSKLLAFEREKEERKKDEF